MAVLEAIAEAPDAAAQRIEGSADAVPDAAAPLGRDFRHDAAVVQVLPDRVAVVRLHQRVVVRAVGLVAGGHVQDDGQAMRVAAELERAREATSRAPKTLAIGPLSPAAQ
ncbi:hypothetical protein [Elioraea sp.]|uniref:hypothetical protein n=1 Tax=Elioraea sp. TaxID=2185103 RepID=UPI00307F69BB